MKLPGRAGHLSYCTNIHPGETWDDLVELLRTSVPAVKRAVHPDGPFGIGLRLSGRAVDAASRPERTAELKALLAAADLYVYTINAFPHGAFHGTRVKEAVYLPDWRDPERLRYANAAADLLAALLPDGLTGSVSTVPGAFKPTLSCDADIEVMAEAMLRHAAHLVILERRTGQRIALAVEPEPCCFLDTTDEVVAFFEGYLFSGAASRRLAALADLTIPDAVVALRRHLGLCLDLCHAAVEFEDPAEVLGKLRGAGIGVPKLQVSAGLQLPRAGPDTRALLRPFDDGIYFHQVVERRPDGLHRYRDLPEALIALEGSSAACPPEWRVHYHVPLILDHLGAMRSTQGFVREALALHRRQPISDHIEIETYTWDVLPERYRDAGLVPAIARELQWVERQLSA